jgi:ribonuclease R
MEIDKKKILAYLSQNDYRPLLLRDLYRVFGVSTKDGKARFRQTIKELAAEGAIQKDSTNRYTLASVPEINPVENGLPAGVPVGSLEFTRNGNMAFCLANDGIEYVIFPEDAKFALHRDLVQLKPGGFYKEWRRAQVAKILQRNLTQIVGILAREGRNYFIIPDDKRMGMRYYLPGSEKKDLLGTELGEKVIGRITGYPSRKDAPKAKITERLGHIQNPAVHLPTVIVKHGLPFPEEYPEAVLAEADKIPDRVYPKEYQDRKDYRTKTVFTIDGENAKDFDDAVGIERMENGHYQLYVHIADVSHYVKSDSEIDREAYKRGTSTYLIDTVIPMLPVRLSNGICSLKEKRNRLTLSVEMEIDQNGKTVRYSCHEGVINSQKRLTYTAVNAFLNGESPSNSVAGISEIPEIRDALLMMDELSEILRRYRKNRGAIIEIESGDVEIVLDSEGNTADIILRSRNRAESLIEEFMIKANETVAGIFAECGLPFIYRVHERPDPETLLQLKNYIQALGIQRKFPKDVKSTDIQFFLENLQEHPLKRSIERLVVRSMKRAVYHEDNIGHYGLASDSYTHFTSPIRRYPDLVVHRLLKQWMKVAQYDYPLGKLHTIARQSSTRERVSTEAEWDIISLKKVNYVSRNLAEVYEVVVTNVQKFGLFVEIPEKSIPGLIPISTLDDYYLFDEDRNILIGERTRKIYKIGDCLKVRVKDIDYVRGEIDFEMLR